MAAVGATRVTGDELVQWKAESALHAVVDVRERGEYILGHIPGAVNISRGRLELRLPKLVALRSVPILFYCDDAHRSTLAAETARELGYSNANVLAGGLQAWAAAGQDVAYGVNVIGKDYGERIAVERGIRQISPQGLDELRAVNNVAIFDVRTPGEFEREGHLEGAINVPGGELAVAVIAQMQSAAPPEEIVLNCAGRTRSIVATDLLLSLGITNVWALENGTMAWLMAGRTLETGRGAGPTTVPAPSAVAGAGEMALRAAAEQGIPAIDGKALLAARNEDEFMYVLDVRTPQEFAAASIAGAVSCPAGQLTNYLDDTVAVRQAPIVCYSNDQTRAIFAARTLLGIGYPNVRWLAGGLTAWKAAAAPTSRGPAPDLSGTGDWSGEGAVGITCDEFARGAVGGSQALIDIRQASDFMFGHLPGSVWMPRGDLERRIPKTVNPAQEVVLIADNALVGRLAACTLRQLGYLNVLVLQGGVSAWKSTGRELMEGSDGSDINLLAAREEADLVGFGPQELRRTTEDMVRYLEWEERLGDKYRDEAVPAGRDPRTTT